MSLNHIQYPHGHVISHIIKLELSRQPEPELSQESEPQI
jgi:hypothetical protein